MKKIISTLFIYFLTFGKKFQPNENWV